MSFRKMTDTLESEYLSLDLNEYWQLRELNETEEEEYFSSAPLQPLNDKKNKYADVVYFEPEELTEEQAKHLQPENELVDIKDIKMSLDGEITAIENELLFAYHM